MGIISQLHIEEELKDKNKLTIHRDATTKQGHHYYGLKLSTDEKELTIGLKEISRGTAKKYIDATNKLLKPIQSEIPITAKISNSITDRSATEIKTNHLLTDIKKTHLQDSMDIEQNEHIEINSFHCSVHPLLQFSESCEKAVKEIEKKYNVSEPTVFCKKGESYTHNLIRCVSKLFYDDKSGDPLLASQFLKSKGVKDKPIIKFKGNRFNTYFFNACGTFIIQKHIIEYLSSKSTLNLLQSAIMIFLKNKTIMSVCQALALICQQITTPYWKVAASDKNPLEMNTFYTQMIAYLTKLSKDPNEIYNTSLQIFQNETVTNDVTPTTETLRSTADTSPDVLYDTISACSLNLLEKCKKLFSDHLEGGKHFDPTDLKIDEAKSCPSNNISLERLMGQLDRHRTISPNISIDSLNAKICFKNNDTQDWLNTKTETQQEEIFKVARKRSFDQISEIRNEKLDLEKERLEIIENRRVEKEQKLQKTNDAHQKICNDVENMGGMWTNVEGMEFFLRKTKYQKEQMAGIKSQISYRKEILKTSIDNKELFKKSVSLESLKYNMTKIIEIENQSENINSEVCLLPTQLTAENTLENTQSSVPCANSDPTLTTYIRSTSETTTSPISTSTTTASSTSSVSTNIDLNTSTTVASQSQSSVPSSSSSSMKPPKYYIGKYILHTWDEGEYKGKIMKYMPRKKTYMVNSFSLFITSYLLTKERILFYLN